MRGTNWSGCGDRREGAGVGIELITFQLGVGVGRELITFTSGSSEEGRKMPLPLLWRSSTRSSAGENWWEGGAGGRGREGTTALFCFGFFAKI